MGWLDFADKVGSVVGAVTGVVSIVVAVLSVPRRPRRRGGRTWWVAVAVVCAGGLVARFSPAVPARVAHAAGWVALAAGILLALFLLGRVSRRPRVALPEPVRALAAAERQYGVPHRYRFFGHIVPALAEIYVCAQVVPEELRTGGADPVAGLSIRDVLAQHEHIVLTGGPGAGKSTLIATTAQEIARGTPGSAGVVAVAVTAGDLVDHPVPEALAAACRRDLGVELPGEVFTSPPYPGGQWCVLVDGVDEVVDVDARWRLLQRLREAATRSDGASRYLVTTRPLPAGELTGLRRAGYRAYELRPFSRRDLDRFAELWFKARTPDDPERAGTEANRFLARVTGARLGPVARVPLLATIAAVVYEQDGASALPSSRAALYHSFVTHLLDGRALLGDFQAILGPPLSKRGEPGRSLANWFDANFYRTVSALLDEAGRAWLADPDVDPVTVAVSWLRAHAPHDLTEVLPDGTRIVRELLRTTGLFYERHDRLAFVHQSFAEYFAARASADRFDPNRWREQVGNLATRSYAAFAAAMRPDADAAALVAGLRDDPVAAGDLIADGVPVSETTRADVIDALIERVRGEHDSTPECLSVLRELSLAADVLARLVALVDDQSVGPWARVYAADTIADVNHALGVRLLTECRETLPDSEAQSWAVIALKAHGVEVTSHYRTVGFRLGQSLTGLARASLAQVVRDETGGRDGRVEAAIRLAADGGDLEPLRGLADSVELDHLTRVRAAVELARLGEDDRLVDLAGPDRPPLDADEPVGWPRSVERIHERYEATAALFRTGHPRAGELLRAFFDEVVTVPNATTLAFGIAARLGRIGDRSALVSVATGRPRPAEPAVAAARRLAATGSVDDLRAVLEDARDRRVREWAALGLVRRGDQTSAPRPIRPRGRLRVEILHAFAAQGDPAALAALRRTARRPVHRIRTRIRAAVALGMLGDPVAAEAAARISRAPYRSARTRVLAAASVSRATGSTAILGYLASSKVRPGVRLRAARSLAQRFGDAIPMADLAVDPRAPVRRRTDALEYLSFVKLPEDPWAERLALLAEQPGTPRPVRILAAGLAMPDRRAEKALSELIDDRRTRSWQRVRAAAQLRPFDPEAADAALHAIAYDSRIWRLVRIHAMKEIETAQPELARLEQDLNELTDRWPVLWPLFLTRLDWPSPDPGHG